MPSWRPGAVYFMPTSDGREIGVYPELYGTARLYRGALADHTFYDESWRYDSVEEAVAAAEAWDGEGDAPPGGVPTEQVIGAHKLKVTEPG